MCLSSWGQWAAGAALLCRVGLRNWSVRYRVHNFVSIRNKQNNLHQTLSIHSMPGYNIERYLSVLHGELVGWAKV